MGWVGWGGAVLAAAHGLGKMSSIGNMQCCMVPQACCHSSIDMACALAVNPRPALPPSCRVWDMRPYAPTNRCTKVFAGHVHTFEKNLLRCDWSPDGAKVRGRGMRRAREAELLHAYWHAVYFFSTPWPSHQRSRVC